MVGKNDSIPIDEGREIVREHALESGKDGLIRELNVDKEIGNPVAGTDVVLKFNGVGLDHWNQHCWGEGGIGVLETNCHVTHHVDDGFVGSFGSMGVVGDFVVGSIKIILPCNVDILFTSVVGGFEDHQTDVVVLSLIGVLVVKLDMSAMLRS